MGVGERCALLRHGCDTPGCGQPHQCPVLKCAGLLLQTPVLPSQGLKAAEAVGQEQGARGQVLGVLGVWGASSGEKGTHPTETVT